MLDDWRAREVAEKILGKQAKAAEKVGATTPETAEIVDYLDTIKSMAESILDECACARALVTESGASR